MSSREEQKAWSFGERYGFKTRSRFANHEYRQGQALEQLRNFDFAEMERRVIANMAAQGYDLTTRVHDELCFEKRRRKKLNALSVKLLMRWEDEFYTTSKDMRVRTIGHGQMEVKAPLTAEEASAAFIFNTWLDGDAKFVDGGFCENCKGYWYGSPKCPNCDKVDNAAAAG